MEMTKEEPPKETKGRGIPFVGKAAVTTAMLRDAWRPMKKTTPKARRKPR
jgi:hypothetical protein